MAYHKVKKFSTNTWEEIILICLGQIKLVCMAHPSSSNDEYHESNLWQCQFLYGMFARICVDTMLGFLHIVVKH
jgi:hypothetical protein